MKFFWYKTHSFFKIKTSRYYAERFIMFRLFGLGLNVYIKTKPL